MTAPFDKTVDGLFMLVPIRLGHLVRHNVGFMQSRLACTHALAATRLAQTARSAIAAAAQTRTQARVMLERHCGQFVPIATSSFSMASRVDAPARYISRTSGSCRAAYVDRHTERRKAHTTPGILAP